MRERYPKLFDSLVWPAVIIGDACLLLNMVSASFLAVQQMKATQGQLALIGASSSAMYALACPIMARLGPKIGLKRMVVTGAALYALWSLLLTQAGSLWQLAACYALCGLAGSILWPNLEAALAQGWSGPLLRRRLSVFNAMWCAGTILGPLLGAWLYPSEAAVAAVGGRAAINVVFYSTTALATGMALFLMPWRSRLPGPTEAAVHEVGEAPRDAVLLGTFRTMSYVANFMCYVVLGVLRQLYEALANEQWAGQNPARLHNLLLVGLAGASMVTFVVMFFAHRWSYRLKRYISCQALIAAALVLVALSGDFWWSALGFAVIGVTSSFIYSGSLFYSVEGQDSSTHMAGWHEAMLGAGGACGLLLTGQMPWFLGCLGVTSGYWVARSPYLLAVLVFVLGIVVQLAIYRRNQPRFGNGAARAAA